MDLINEAIENARTIGRTDHEVQAMFARSVTLSTDRYKINELRASAEEVLALASLDLHPAERAD